MVPFALATLSVSPSRSARSMLLARTSFQLHVDDDISHGGQISLQLEKNHELRVSFRADPLKK